MSLLTPKILIENKENQQGAKIAALLSEAGIYAVNRNNLSEKIFKELKNNNFNALLIDNSYDDTDENFERIILSENLNMQIFVLTNETQIYIKESNGILFISGSIGIRNICELIRYCLNEGKCFNKRIENAVSRTLLYLGVQTNLKGYRYLLTAVIQVAKNPSLIRNINQNLYQIIARLYNTSTQNIERSIRHSLDLAYERGNPKKFEDFFSYNVGKPSNTEFISLVAEKVRLEVL